jgi:hypothetical protein
MSDSEGYDNQLIATGHWEAAEDSAALVVDK